MSLYNQLPENSYIKKLLVGINEDFVERFLQMKKNYETATDKEDKRMYRDKVGSMFWELYNQVAQMVNIEMSTAKRLFLRYGLVDLRNLSPEDQQFILNQPIKPVDYESETIYYIDEWLQGILIGKIKPSSGDETNSAKDKSATKTLQQIDGKQEKYHSLLQVEQNRFNTFKESRDKVLQILEQQLKIMRESYVHEVTNQEGVFTIAQIKAVDSLSDIQKELRKLNKEISASVQTIAKAQESLNSIARKEGKEDGIVFNVMQDTISSEVANIRQMAKMTVGRQGNSFPCLTSGFMPKETKEYLFKENVKQKMNNWLDLDPEAFNRTYKGEILNIQPYIILVPSYGVTGACWEPLDTDNKQFGRGRITLPIFTKVPDLSLLTAIGDIRWQSAKELASYYWMEEGLTGRYYEYYLDAKLKGDLRTLFITDYILWMTKETQGVQKLEQNARYVFWRYVPLPDEKKIQLSQKGYYYSQLWEKEQVWRHSKNK